MRQIKKYYPFTLSVTVLMKFLNELFVLLRGDHTRLKTADQMLTESRELSFMFGVNED